MSGLPAISGEKAVETFTRCGWAVARRASHIILTKPESVVSLSVPNHRELAPGTLRKLIKLAGLSVDEFVSILK